LTKTFVVSIENLEKNYKVFAIVSDIIDVGKQKPSAQGQKLTVTSAKKTACANRMDGGNQNKLAPWKESFNSRRKILW